MLDYFKATYGLRDQDILVFPYGSRVYGTHSEASDHDFIVVVPANRRASTGTEFRHDKVNVHIYNRMHFQDQLQNHKIHALEAYFLGPCDFSFNLDLGILRESLAAKASHSFVKAKKKMLVEKDFYLGWKSLFHSLRILMFGTQIALKGKIVDYSAANAHWFEILTAGQYNWDYFEEKYKPLFNDLASEFRRVAPKGSRRSRS